MIASMLLMAGLGTRRARAAEESAPTSAAEAKPAGPLKGWMPNFSKTGMTMTEAQQIAKYLLCDTATDPNSHPECR